MVRRFIKQLILILIVIGLFSGGVFFLWASSLNMPDFSSFEERKVAQSTKIYDRTGKVLLYDIHQNIKRTLVPFSKISRHIKNATVAIEDAEFYEHRGVKPTAILRAFISNLKKDGIKQGGSTITQQVIKNTLLSSEKKIARKLKEAILSFRLESVMEKDEILSLYLNETPYGGIMYGVEEASKSFFDKKAIDVTLVEAAYLAAIPQAPTFYSPYGNNRDKLEERKNLVLRRMAELGFIEKEEAEEAKKEKVEFLPRSDKGILSPHFVIFIKSYLEEKYGKEMVETGGFKVTTTLDWALQEKAEQVVAEYAEQNEKKFNATNAGMIGLDPKTGQILVMVGSRDYFDEEIDGNFNITLAHRQPGSAFKPFVYATAFDKGYTPETVVFDLKTEFQTTCNPDGTPKTTENDPDACYSPGNYDNVFRGPTSFRNALAQSINVPSVKVLYLAGLSDSLKTAKKMGINSLEDANRYGLTLVLGGGEVSLLEITSAYGTFANEGVKNQPTKILKIEDGQGNILEQFTSQSKRVLNKNTALKISDILSDNNARAPAFGEYSYLYFPDRDMAVKTGTTNNYRDAWIIGYTPNFALGAWAGNNDNSSMEKKVAGFIVAPMWNAFFKEVLVNLPKEKFAKPDYLSSIETKKLKPFLRGFWQGGRTYKIDVISGKLATEYTPPELIEEKVLTQIHSILYWLDKKNPLGPAPEKPKNDPQFELWEYSIRKWVESQNIKEQDENDIPKEIDDVHKPEFAPKITIISPSLNNIYSVQNRITVQIKIKSEFSISQVDFFLNNRFLGSSAKAPFSFSFMPGNIEGVKTDNEIKVIVYDNVRNKGTATIPLKLKF